MNDHRAFEREIRAVFEDQAPMLPPNHLLQSFKFNARHTRRYPRWLALIKEPPMRTNSHLAVGSPTVRVAAILVATLLLAVAMAAAGVAGARILAAGPIVVAQDGSGHYTTITEAVAVAQDGDEILVKPGTYAEVILIDKDVTLRGDGPREEVVLEYGEDGPAIPSWSGPAPYGLMLVDTEAVVSDLTLRGPNSGVAFVLVGGAPTLERVANEHEGAFSGRAQVSVAPLHGAGATLRDSSLSGPVWESEAGSLPEYEGITGSGRWVIEDNVSDGLWLGGITDGSQILRNTITETGDIEVHLKGGGTLLIANNELKSIELDEPPGDGVTIRDNVLQGAADDQAAIALGSGTPIVEGNVITDVKTGILVPDGASPTITGNQLEGLGVGIALGSGTSAVIEGNRFCGNERDLFALSDPSVTLDPSNEICETDAAA